ncbi:hypothetical protein AYI68_g2191 [Smittium mucronatum]|uniref:Uncharacterized protein n=1 Tax=Smittium mucronatum TaxID=133383 RepID=A0A1R0H3H5_9FUNG|nr:hypothetical protein AYI68_g2191 [Smittium mucronatum]
MYNIDETLKFYLEISSITQKIPSCRPRKPLCFPMRSHAVDVTDLNIFHDNSICNYFFNTSFRISSLEGTLIFDLSVTIASFNNSHDFVYSDYSQLALILFLFSAIPSCSFTLTRNSIIRLPKPLLNPFALQSTLLQRNSCHSQSPIIALHKCKYTSPISSFNAPASPISSNKIAFYVVNPKNNVVYISI